MLKKIILGLSLVSVNFIAPSTIPALEKDLFIYNDGTLILEGAYKEDFTFVRLGEYEGKIWLSKVDSYQYFSNERTKEVTVTFTKGTKHTVKMPEKVTLFVIDNFDGKKYRVNTNAEDANQFTEEKLTACECTIS